MDDFEKLKAIQIRICEYLLRRQEAKKNHLNVKSFF